MTTRTKLARSFARTMRPAAMLATAAVALLSTLSATDVQAQRDGSERPRLGQDERIETARGTVKFSHHGEVVEALDKKLDGYGIRATVTGVPPVTDYYAPDKKPVRMKRSIPEGSLRYLRLCYTKNHKIAEDESGEPMCSRPQLAIS